MTVVDHGMCSDERVSVCFGQVGEQRDRRAPVCACWLMFVVSTGLLFYSVLFVVKCLCRRWDSNPRPHRGPEHPEEHS